MQAQFWTSAASIRLNLADTAVEEEGGLIWAWVDRALVYFVQKEVVVVRLRKTVGDPQGVVVA